MRSQESDTTERLNSNNVIVLYSTFWGNSVLFSTVVAPVYLRSYQQYRRVPFSPHPGPSVISCFSENSQPKRCRVIPHCGFDLYFSNNEQCRASFHVFIGHSCLALNTLTNTRASFAVWKVYVYGDIIGSSFSSLLVNNVFARPFFMPTKERVSKC